MKCNGSGAGHCPRSSDWVPSYAISRPEQCPTVTLVHGDPKPGNFAFADDEVSAVFDWEMTSVGDPLADIGWAECNWTTPGSFTSRPGALDAR